MIVANEKQLWIETPLIRSPTLSDAAGCNVFLKLENLQPSGSFKSRGLGHFMTTKLSSLEPGHGPVHFYNSSGGNAGLACALAAVTLGCPATIVVPVSTSAGMMRKIQKAGAVDVIQKGASWQEADDYLVGTVMVEARARGEEAIYVPPFDAQEIWDGNAGIVREIQKQIGQVSAHYPISLDGHNHNHHHHHGHSGKITNVDAVVCSVGGGGLFCGIMQGLDELGMKHTKVIAVETQGADSLAQAVHKRELVTLPGITSLATSLGARRVCSKALEYGLSEFASTRVLPDLEAIAACKRFADEERFLVELSCSVCPALCYNGMLKDLVPGFHKGSVVVLVICGGCNISHEILDQYIRDHPGENHTGTEGMSGRILGERWKVVD